MICAGSVMVSDLTINCIEAGNLCKVINLLIEDKSDSIKLYLKYLK